MPAIYPCTECGNEEPERATASAISESSPAEEVWLRMRRAERP